MNNFMKCPKCSYEMSTVSTDKTTESYSGKPCERKRFVCSYDKTRVTSEVLEEEKKEGE